ncbi:hypothetical protein BAE29_12285 [Acidithiobacillus caldus]|jgi:hypothetical protein|uniref:Uncharacterized protein n=1 Tax=Acidithiobacillus caldus TaxID=33059 RepID=A0A1E7YPY3_9PROT|nr:hypothetical protein BAE29_12285 [Acidithiobacillus caldus]OFC37416.1 hypothetical protein BAE28_07190 [Acidithiobacillus caldus]OFC37665.1 hypothetical protein BAE27_03790 [Acidithiobacillus caldus]OFC59393.1 hypothetical protein BAE30_08630 [Acidithiobacillus caldus]
MLCTIAQRGWLWFGSSGGAATLRCKGAKHGEEHTVLLTGYGAAKITMPAGDDTGLFARPGHAPESREA